MGSSLMLPELSRLGLWEPGSRFVIALREQRRPMTGLNALREQGKMAWIEQKHGPGSALAGDGGAAKWKNDRL